MMPFVGTALCYDFAQHIELFVFIIYSSLQLILVGGGSLDKRGVVSLIQEKFGHLCVTNDRNQDTLRRNRFIVRVFVHKRTDST